VEKWQEPPYSIFESKILACKMSLPTKAMTMKTLDLDFLREGPFAEISHNRGLLMSFFDVLLSRVPGDVVQSSCFLQAN
jgi:hypothetical protein